MDQEYAAPAIVADNVLQKNWNEERERALEDPEKFWAEYARNFRMVAALGKSPRMGWRASQMVCRRQDQHYPECSGPACQERPIQSRRVHLARRRRLRARGHLRSALPHGVPILQGLRSLGVGKGDRVVIYMPLTIEGVVSMLACARIGAIHSVVYAGSATPRCATASPMRRPRLSSPGSRRPPRQTVALKPSSMRLSTAWTRSKT